MQFFGFGHHGTMCFWMYPVAMTPNLWFVAWRNPSLWAHPKQKAAKLPKRKLISNWVFPKIGVPQNGWWTYWKTLLKWMIWGYPYFRKNPTRPSGYNSWQSVEHDHLFTLGNFLAGALGSWNPAPKIHLHDHYSVLAGPNVYVLSLRIQSPSQIMIGVYNHFLRKVFRFHYHSQKVIGSLGYIIDIIRYMWYMCFFSNSSMAPTCWKKAQVVSDGNVHLAWGDLFFSHRWIESGK